MSDTSTNEPGAEPAVDDPPLYLVEQGSDDCAVAEGLTLPRRPGHGSRGVLLVDVPNSLVYLLDADDDARVFRGRARRELAGDRTDLRPPLRGTDHVVRAAYETDYDVIAAPWAGADDAEAPAVAQ